MAPKAEFFGDPLRLENCIKKRRKEKTIFCDIDGTLVRHMANPSLDADKTVVLEGSREKLKWQGGEQLKIVLYGESINSANNT